MTIEIHNENTNETGTYKIWFTHNGTTYAIRASETFTNSLLNMRQKEDFFMGKYRFKITSPYDQKLLLNADPNNTIRHSAEVENWLICKGCQSKFPKIYNAEPKEYCHLCDINQ